jgi:hypothetical protein
VLSHSRFLAYYNKEVKGIAFMDMQVNSGVIWGESFFFGINGVNYSTTGN